MDSTIRTFDIPTGRLIDAFRTASIATSVTFSPTGDFLATSHVDSVGVYLWCVFGFKKSGKCVLIVVARANRAQYSEVSYKTISPDDAVAIEVALPSLQGLAEDDGARSHSLQVCINPYVLRAALEGMADLTIKDTTDLFVTPNQLDEDLITLTLLPRSRWQTLLNLEVIQVSYITALLALHIFILFHAATK